MLLYMQIFRSTVQDLAIVKRENVIKKMIGRCVGRIVKEKKVFKTDMSFICSDIAHEQMAVYPPGVWT